MRRGIAIVDRFDRTALAGAAAATAVLALALPRGSLRAARSSPTVLATRSGRRLFGSPARRAT
jgi:hypothetical protein